MDILSQNRSNLTVFKGVYSPKNENFNLLLIHMSFQICMTFFFCGTKKYFEYCQGPKSIGPYWLEFYGQKHWDSVFMFLRRKEYQMNFGGNSDAHFFHLMNWSLISSWLDQQKSITVFVFWILFLFQHYDNIEHDKQYNKKKNTT